MSFLGCSSGPDHSGPAKSAFSVLSLVCWLSPGCPQPAARSHSDLWPGSLLLALLPQHPHSLLLPEELGHIFVHRVASSLPSPCALGSAVPDLSVYCLFTLEAMCSGAGVCLCSATSQSRAVILGIKFRLSSTGTSCSGLLHPVPFLAEGGQQQPVTPRPIGRIQGGMSVMASACDRSWLVSFIPFPFSQSLKLQYPFFQVSLCPPPPACPRHPRSPGQRTNIN